MGSIEVFLSLHVRYGFRSVSSVVGVGFHGASSPLLSWVSSLGVESCVDSSLSSRYWIHLPRQLLSFPCQFVRVTDSFSWLWVNFFEFAVTVRPLVCMDSLVASCGFVPLLALQYYFSDGPSSFPLDLVSLRMWGWVLP